MFKKLLAISFIFLSKYGIANNDTDIIDADKFFNSGNFTKLEQLHSNNKYNLIVNYLNAKAQLIINNPYAAEVFIQSMPNSFMRNDLIHQLLIFYFKYERYNEYKNTYYRLAFPQASTNETCGLDISNIMLKTTISPISNINYLVKNNITPWCTNLLVLIAKQNKITDIQKNIMLFNLLTYDKSGSFNEYAKYLNINYKKNDLNTNRYAIVRYITQLAKSDPDKALHVLNDKRLDPITESFLQNYLAFQFAIKLNFLKAKELFSTTDSLYFSDDEYEWRVRTFLYFMNWSMVLQTIEQMPDELKNKNVWLYWKAKAFDSKNQPKEANNLLEKIPNDYSYYSMLAQAELDKNLVFKTLPTKIPELKSNQFSNEVISTLKLYMLGLKNNSKNLINIATYQWFFLAKQASQPDLLSMANMAYRNQLYDLSIFTANKINIRYIDFSFPTPFLTLFNEYSTLFKIDPTHALAVSRQESRFNKNVIAFDGGVGLMQLMPNTADYIAHKSGSNKCYRNSAACNIKFGTWYLGSLYNKFSGNLIYSTAAYNSGPNRAKRWNNQLNRLDAKIQIELIPISITRDYVQKVISNKAIYDTRLNNKNINQINLLNYVNNLHYSHNTFNFSSFFKQKESQSENI